jgi:CubicO group peptidase (beta-lactamase class C family)
LTANPISCECDSGFSGPDCGPPEFKLIDPMYSVEASKSIDIKAIVGGSCGPGVNWQIKSGGGAIAGSGKTAVYTAPATVEGLVDVVTIHAVADNCPEMGDGTSVHVAPSGVGPILGRADPTFEPVDQGVLDYMDDNGIFGGSVTLSFQERIVYNKAFGYAHAVFPLENSEVMTPGHLMRIASCSKPITRAAIRQMQSEGLLVPGPAGLGESVFSILQTEGGNLLGLDQNNMPAAPLGGNEYLTGSPMLCDTQTPPSCPPAMSPPLMCPIGSQFGATCPAGAVANGVGGFTLTPFWNPDGNNPRIGGTPQYDCPTDDTGQLDVALWQLMTVGDLFWHRGGFYRGVNWLDVANPNNTINGDPHTEPIYISQRLPLNHPPPPTYEDIARFMAGSCLYYQPVGCNDSCCFSGTLPGPVDPFGYCTPLDGDTYSNFGYNTLGKIIEIRSGMPYPQYVKERLFAPNGIEDILIGRTRPENRYDREGDYYSTGLKMAGNIFAAECSAGDDPQCEDGTWEFPEQVLVPDGGNFALEYRQASGGWVATSCDLVKFLKFYRETDGFPRTLGSFPTAGEGSAFGGFDGTRCYVAQWGDPITIVDTVNVPQGCTSWGCLGSMQVNFPLGPGWHVAAIFNKRECTATDCDDPGGFDFTKHDKAVLPNQIAQGLVQVTMIPSQEVICGCGSGLRDAGEECDGADLGGASCVGFGFEGGQLACTDECEYDTTPCNLCGNGVLDVAEGEVCDAPAFGGKSCASFGFEMGDLICTACLFIDTANCSGGMANNPPNSYQQCGFAPESCGGGTCVNAQGDCPGGPCKKTEPGDYESALADPLNTSGGEFHPDGNFRDQDENLYYCQQDGDTHMACINQNGWGVCRRCSKFEGEQNTLVGCPCDTEDDCESAAFPGLSCFGEDFGGGIGFCWDEQDGPPQWQCREGICGQAPWYGDDTMYCEHYPDPGGTAHCEPWLNCNPQLARICAAEGLICEQDAPAACATDDCCAQGCQVDDHCTPAFGWPDNYTCENTPQDLQCVGP